MACSTTAQLRCSPVVVWSLLCPKCCHLLFSSQPPVSSSLFTKVFIFLAMFFPRKLLQAIKDVILQALW